MGYPIFQYIKHLFLATISNKNLSDLQCEIYEFAKHQCTSFLKSKYTPSKPFTVIHSDL